MIKKEKKALENVENLISHNNALYSVLFSQKKFQRQYRRFFKFSIPNESTICLKSKITKKGIKIKLEGDDYYLVTHRGTLHGFLLNVRTQKELIQKMIKHNIY